MKKQDLNKKSKKELLKIVTEGKEQLREEKFNASGATTKDSFQRRKIRKNIARALTALNNSNKK